MQRRVLLVIANPATASTTGWPVGFWAAELTHPYHAFTEQGFAVTIASPRGGKVELDGWSDPRDPSGYSKDDALSLRYLEDPEFVARLEQTPAVGSLAVEDFDAIVVAGGQAPMFTFAEETALQEKFLEFDRAGKITAALCHGTSLLLHLQRPDGRPFVAGRRMTGFANAEEDAADAAVGQKIMPFRIEDEARALGADFVAAPAFEPHALRDDRLITGQQQHSSAATAQLVIEALAQDAKQAAR